MANLLDFHFIQIDKRTILYFRFVLFVSQLLRGSSDSDVKQYHLSRDPNQYFYTNQGSKETLSEQTDYKATTNAFKALGFTNDEVSSIWKIVSAVLHLGNISFKTEEDNIVIANKNSLQNAARLLQVTESEMTNSLTQRVIAAHGDVMMKSHNVTQAEFGRDALAKAIYDRLFTWIINRINKSIIVPGQKRYNNVIGVLDIYGFEIFDMNSFEQFCINYCNEKLQQLFIGGCQKKIFFT